MGLVEVESRLAGGGDLGEPAGDPEMLVWVRAGEAAAGTVAAKAMLAYASEPWFVAAALRRHEGWSQDQAFTRFVPAVVSHSLWFHEHEDLAGWWAFQASSPHLRHGRVFGRADVRSAAGRLLASVSQENLLRPLT
jgi:acyl-CoA thioesterase-2